MAPAPRRRGLAARTGRGGRRPSFLGQARASEPPGGKRWREEALRPEHIRASRASVWPPRSGVDPPAPDLNGRGPSPALPCASAPFHPPRGRRPTPSRRPFAPSRLRQDHLALDRRPTWVPRVRGNPCLSEPTGAGCSGPRCPQTRRDCRRGDASSAERPVAGRSRRAAASGRVDWESAGGGPSPRQRLFRGRERVFPLSPHPRLCRVSEDRPRSLALCSVVNTYCRLRR